MSKHHGIFGGFIIPIVALIAVVISLFFLVSKERNIPAIVLIVVLTLVIADMVWYEFTYWRLIWKEKKTLQKEELRL